MVRAWRPTIADRTSALTGERPSANVASVRDVLLALGWAVVLAGGLGTCAALFRLGVPRTFVRDLLHVGAGVWVLGWPWWSRPWLPGALTLGALAFIASVPALSTRAGALAKLRDGVSGGDERWSGLVLYTASFAAMTWLGLLHAPFPAAAALWSLSLGDGIGGAVGRRFGGLRFQFPFAKPKSVEGSAAVALAAAAGIALAGGWFHAPLTPAALATGALAAALAEAAAPRASDNLAVPAAVWIALVALG